MKVGVDTSPLVQTRAGTARHVRGLLGALRDRPGLDLELLSFGGPGRASSVARDAVWYPVALGRPENREVVHREHRRHAGGDGAAERRAVQDVERAGTTPEADRVPHCIPYGARRSSRPAERQELEVEPRSIAECAEKPAYVPRRAGARLHERRGVDPDLHCSSRAAARTASFVVS